MNLTKLIFFSLFNLCVSNSFSQQDIIEADNGFLSVKLDLTRGGAICYVSVSGSEKNLVNIADEGRYIQQSYYAGHLIDRQKEGQSARWSPWPWNPIQVGDAFGNRAEILHFDKKGDTLYVKCIPMLWDMNNKPAEAVMEQWTVLKGNMLEVRNRLTCMRNDTIYEDGIMNDQELPAVYPVSELKHLFYYGGSRPFTNDTLTSPEVINLSSGFWGTYSGVSEHWMAFVDDDKFGMGVYNPQCTKFLAGMAGEPDKDAKSSSTSYIAPVKKEALKKNSVYEYTYYIIVGDLSDIRSRVSELNRNKNYSTDERKSSDE